MFIHNSSGLSTATGGVIVSGTQSEALNQIAQNVDDYCDTIDQDWSLKRGSVALFDSFVIQTMHMKMKTAPNGGRINAGIYGNTVNALKSQILHLLQILLQFQLKEDTVLNIDLESNSSDENNDDLTFILSTSPANGTASIANSTLTFTPNLNWSGQETIAFKANDGFEDSNISIVIYYCKSYK